jgi:Uma2 family endonuclease
MALPHQDNWTEAEYLAFERESELKHEYAAGTVRAMTGASWSHNVICVNISTSLNVQLAQTDCRVTSGDMRLHIAAAHTYRYPDVMVVCDKPQFVGERVDTIANPLVVIEVLSASTELIDRNTKLDEYLQIPSLQAYLLVAQQTAKVERYLRQASGDWLYTPVIGTSARLALPAVGGDNGCTLSLADIYRKVEV